MRVGRAIGAALILGSPGTASADPASLAEAMSLYEAGELDGALGALERALEVGGNRGDELRAIYLHLGILRAGAGDDDGAQAAFRALLCLDPSTEERPGWSPIVADPFERARAARGKAPGLSAEIDAPSSIGRTSAFVARVAARSDTEGLVGAARLVVDEAPGAATQVRGTGPWRLGLPDAAHAHGRLGYRVELLDRHGSVLWASEPLAVAVVVEASGPEPSTPLGRGPLVWAGVTLTVVLVGAATITGVLALQGESEYRDPDTSIARRNELYDSTPDLAVATDFLAAGAALVGLGTVGLYLLAGPDGPDERAAAPPRLAATP